MLRIHKTCSGVKGALKKESMFRCNKCKGESVPTDSLNSTQVHVDKDTFEALSTFQYLGDVIGESGISLRNQGNIFSSCIRKSLLYGCETWSTSTETMRRLTSADYGMLRWICSVRLEQRFRTQELHQKLGIISVPEEIRWRRLR